MKAVVLAAGEGRRLEPLTNVRPKPMIPIANKPLLEYVVEALASAGIDEIVLVVGYKRERIQDHFGDGDEWGVDISYAVQDKQLGTGDAVLRAEPYIGGDLLVLNGDRIVDPEVIEALIEERRETGDDVMAVTQVDEPELYGVVEVDGDRVVRIREKPPEHEIASDLINAGVYAFGPAVFSAIRGTESYGELELTATLDAHLDDHPLRVLPYQGTWLDVTRPWDLLTVNGRVLDGQGRTREESAAIDRRATVADATAIGPDATIDPGATVLRGTAIGENVRVGSNAVVRNSLVLSDVTIEPGAVLTDCVVGANSTIGANATAAGGDADVVLDDTVHRDVRFGGMIGDNARIGSAVTVAPGTFVGNDATVGDGATVTGRIDPDTTVLRG